jgi:hypothetical protein
MFTAFQPFRIPISAKLFRIANSSNRRSKIKVKLIFHWARIFSSEQAKSECDWLVMSSVFVASQSEALSNISLPFFHGKMGIGIPSTNTPFL